MRDQQPRQRSADPRRDRGVKQEPQSFWSFDRSVSAQWVAPRRSRYSIEVARAVIDQYAIAHVGAELTPIDAANAKWWSSQVQNDVIAHCVQVQGGRAI